MKNPVFSSGPQGEAADIDALHPHGQPVALSYETNQFDPSRDLYHVNDPNDLMSPTRNPGVAIHSISAIDTGILNDEGWVGGGLGTSATPELPVALLLVAPGPLLLLIRRRRRAG